VVAPQYFDFSDVLVTLPLQEIDLLQQFLLVVPQLSHPTLREQRVEKMKVMAKGESDQHVPTYSMR